MKVKSHSGGLWGPSFLSLLCSVCDLLLHEIPHFCPPVLGSWLLHMAPGDLNSGHYMLTQPTLCSLNHLPGSFVCLILIKYTSHKIYYLTILCAWSSELVCTLTTFTLYHDHLPTPSGYPKQKILTFKMSPPAIFSPPNATRLLLQPSSSIQLPVSLNLNVQN